MLVKQVLYPLNHYASPIIFKKVEKTDNIKNLDHGWELCGRDVLSMHA
jgi:hypothetical protein